MLAACLTEDFALYKIQKDGTLELLLKVKADFSKVDASLNTCSLSWDNSILVTGGDDHLVRCH